MSRLNSKLLRFPPMLSSRSFKTLYFTSNSMIHCKFIFVKGIKSLYFLAYRYWIVWVSFVEKAILFSLNCLCSFLPENWLYLLFLHYIFCSIDLYFYSSAISTLSSLLWTYSYTWSLVTFVLSFCSSILCWLSWDFCPMKSFEISYSISTKWFSEIMIVVELNP